MGCGRVGVTLATLLSEQGHDVCVVDQDSSALDRLGARFHGATVVGTAIDEDVLKQAGIEHADAFAAVTQDDNSNIMAAQIAKEIFGVPKVVCRIYDPWREETYHDLGLDTICPTTLAAHKITSLFGQNDAAGARLAAGV
jgi:trk system potassium uptake protein